jgi:energy-coupling factor transporter transmembrane protein EcfT
MSKNKFNYLKLLSLLPLIFSTLLFLYIFYRAEFYHEGEVFSYYLKYYLISIIFIFLSLLSFFIKKEVKINLYIVFFSSLIMLYFIEAYFVMNNYSNGKKNLIKTGTLTKNGKFSYRDRLDVYNNLKKEGQKVTVTLPPINYISETNQKILALSGISKTKTIYCNENGYFVIYQSDRYGFNNQDSEWDKADIAYLLIGDSNTHGACVNQSDSIAGNLQKKISKEKGIINLGYSGNGPLIELATLREYLPLIKAQRVLWIYYPNDIFDLTFTLENNILSNYLNSKKYSQKLYLKQNKIDENLNQKLLQEVKSQSKFGRQKKLKKFIKLTNLRKMTIENVAEKVTASTIDPRDINLVIKKFKQTLSYANDFANQNNSKLYFVYLPSYPSFSQEKSTQKIMIGLQRYQEIIKIVNDLDISLIDVNKEFQNYENPLELWPNATIKNRHLNELGYKKTTDIIFKKILEFEN